MARGTLDDGSGRSPRLTPRESEVLRQAALGRTNSQVAADLAITVHAVKFHLSSIFRKLGVRNRTEAAVIYANRELGEQASPDGLR